MAFRGEVGFVNFGESVDREQAVLRSADVVAADRLNEGKSGVLMVVPLTSTRRGLPSHIEIEPGTSGLESLSYPKCEDLKSISVERLNHRKGAADPESLFEIGRVLRYLLELSSGFRSFRPPPAGLCRAISSRCRVVRS